MGTTQGTIGDHGLRLGRCQGWHVENACHIDKGTIYTHMYIHVYTICVYIYIYYIYIYYIILYIIYIHISKRTWFLRNHHPICHSMRNVRSEPLVSPRTGPRRRLHCIDPKACHRWRVPAAFGNFGIDTDTQMIPNNYKYILYIPPVYYLIIYT